MVLLSFLGLSQAHGLAICPIQVALDFYNYGKLYVDSGVYANVAHVMTISVRVAWLHFFDRRIFFLFA